MIEGHRRVILARCRRRIQSSEFVARPADRHTRVVHRAAMCHKLNACPWTPPWSNAIGNTPLVRLSRLERDVPGLELYGKLEASNPGGSVKDRAARHMILEGMRSGALGPGKRLLDATSGNTGIAYAMIGAALGFPGDALPAGEREPRTQADPDRLRRRAGVHRSDGRIGRRDRRGPAPLRRRSRAVLLPGPVQQRLQLARALRDDRPGDPGRDRRPHHPLRGRARHQRDVHGHRPVPAGQRPGRGAHLGAARVAAARARGAQAHGLGDRPGHLRRDAGRPRGRDVDRGRPRDDPAPGARRGVAGRRVERRQRRGRADARRRGAAHPRSRRDGGRALRRRRSLSLRALLGRRTRFPRPRRPHSRGRSTT